MLGEFLCVCVHAQVNCDSMPLGPDNPYGVGFTAIETEFETEQEAIREVDPRRSRVWKIKNPHSLNPITGAPAPQCCSPETAPTLL
jgi:primary-amine oxidase